MATQKNKKKWEKNITEEFSKFAQIDINKANLSSVGKLL